MSVSALLHCGLRSQRAMGAAAARRLRGRLFEAELCWSAALAASQHVQSLRNATGNFLGAGSPAAAATGSPQACRRRLAGRHAVHVAVWLPPAAAGHRLHAILPAARDRPGRVAVHLVSAGLDGWAGKSEHGACIGSALLPGGPAPLEPALTLIKPALPCSPAGSALLRSATQSTASPAPRAARSSTMPPTSRWASLSPKRP